MTESVNYRKLTSLETRILKCLLGPKQNEIDSPFSQGKSTEAIAIDLFGDKARAPRTEGRTIKKPVASSLCRSLNQMVKKGLLIKYSPKYKRSWFKFSETCSAYTIVETYLTMEWVNEEGKQVREWLTVKGRRFPHLAYDWRLWWIPTLKAIEMLTPSS